MNAADALRLLAQASYVETTILPASDLDRRIKAEIWAHLLDDIDYDDATAAMHAHYRDSSKPLTPERVRAGVKQRHPAPVTYLDQVRAADADPCDHGEPRGRRYCPLCRRPRPVDATTDIDPRLLDAAPTNITQPTERNAR